MNLTQTQRVGLFAVLALVMAATRINHFGALPDASWAVFFAAGFYLRGSARWAFPLLMAEAVLIDFIVITHQGINFFDAYCVSAAYWFLIAAYGALWAGGSLAHRLYTGTNLHSLGTIALCLLGAVTVCHFVAQGSFYWLSANVPARSLGGWIGNFADWYLPYLRTAAIYSAIGAVLHTAVVQLVRALPQPHHRDAH
ncbi:hypothetical protein [Oleiagrimonas sp. C23AA]|uniref:hypothetical protein n=1 Tax=Oleiagrimonas sp. C23AA TaxID=2719047 RepID=UPI00141DCC82|nr:hypothetical protein [Oleiagrimonas sp. C23AA]NII09922.1 hypothetical protein [Oleiagrimonas sp. C23AA]